MDPKKVTERIEVPRNTGVEGFLRTIEEILKLPRVESVNIEAKGVVSVTRWATEERAPIEVDFETLRPSAVLRNCDRIKELTSGTHPEHTMALLFRAAAADRLYATALVGGASTTFFKWFEKVTGLDLDHDSVYGLPFYRDRHLDDNMLFLCAGYGRGARLIDTVSAYKYLIPEVK